MTVTIPACEQHGGWASMTVTISDYCPNGKRLSEMASVIGARKGTCILNL